MNRTKIYAGGVAVLLFLAGSLIQSRQSQANGAYSTPVTVMNTAAAPALTRDTDNAALQPFVQPIILTGGGNSSSYSGNIVVPAGKRLIIQDMQCVTNTAGSILFADVNPIPAGGQTLVTFRAIPQNASGVYLFDMRIPIYVDPGGFVQISLNTTSLANGTLPVFVTGYYVNFP